MIACLCSLVGGQDLVTTESQGQTEILPLSVLECLPACTSSRHKPQLCQWSPHPVFRTTVPAALLSHQGRRPCSRAIRAGWRCSGGGTSGYRSAALSRLSWSVLTLSSCANLDMSRWGHLLDLQSACIS